MQPLSREKSGPNNSLMYDQILESLSEEDFKNEMEFIGTDP